MFINGGGRRVQHGEGGVSRGDQQSLRRPPPLTPKHLSLPLMRGGAKTICKHLAAADEARLKEKKTRRSFSYASSVKGGFGGRRGVTAAFQTKFQLQCSLDRIKFCFHNAFTILRFFFYASDSRKRNKSRGHKMPLYEPRFSF